MSSINDAAGEFLANRRIAVTDVSRKPENHGRNVVYKRLRERRYEDFAVNPNADEVDGDRSYQAASTRRRGMLRTWAMGRSIAATSP